MQSSSQGVSISKNSNNKKFAKKFPNLSIVVEDNPSSSTQYSPLPTLKKSDRGSRIYSVRNFNKKRFEFPTSEMDKHLQMEQTVEKLELLEVQKNHLLLELQELRNVAVNALIQKQDQIEKLKEKMVQVTNCHHEQQQNQAEMIIEQLQNATQQIEELKKQLEVIRCQYENQLQNKNQMIEDLNYQLEITKLRVQDLKFQDEILTQKLKIAEGENQQLHNELLNSKIHMSVLQESINNSRNLDSSQASNSQKSEIGKNKFEFKLLNSQESHRSDKKQPIQFDQYYEKIDELREMSRRQRQKHQKEIQQLQNHYEQKLEMTRIQFENQLHQFKDQNSYQCYSESVKSEDFNIQVISPNDDKKQVPDYQHILRTQEDRNQIDVKSIKSNYSRRSSLSKMRPKPLIHTHQNQQPDTNLSTKNFNFEKTALSNIKQKYNEQLEKTVAYQNSKKKETKIVQENFSYLNYLFKKKNEIGIVLGSAIVSTLLFSVIKIKK